MKAPLKYIITLLLLLMAINSQAQISKRSKYDFSSVEQKIQSWVNSGFYNGASIIVVKDNEVIFQKYFGNYNPETVAYIASAGKWLAAATFAALVDEGKLNWNDKVSKWLPEFKDVKGEATLAQLLSHTAGYPDYQPKGERPDNYQTLKESVSHIVSLPADTIPGTKFKYGGLALQVAGIMAEVATGKDWETIFQEKIANPLEMFSTHFTPVDETPGHNPMLGGGARTSLQDYANFLNMISNNGMYKGKRILSAVIIKQMQADHVGSAKVNAGEFVENVRGSLRKDIYGLGEWREEVNAKGEAVLISSPSWAGAYPWIDKVNHVYGFFLARVSVMKKGFSSFYASPVLPLLVRDVMKDAGHTEVKRGFVTIKDGAKIFYEELGRGEPLIFIHGHSFDHYEWDPQFYIFSKNYRVIRYDVRGYGQSSMPSEFSSSSHAEDLLQLMDALKIKKAHLVGLSMGGFIVTDFLALHQNRLLSVTAASGDVWEGSPGPVVPWSKEAIAKRRIEIEAYKDKGIFNNKREWFNTLTIRNGKVVEQISEPIWNMIYKWDAWQPLHVEPRFLLGLSVVDKLKQLKVIVPVLVLTGDVDKGRKNILMELVPAAKQAFIKNSGHVCNLENPIGFNNVLNSFLKNIKTIPDQ
jgi:CubicO group peptidase (beta-lactamase class C family)/pimeloyl-ACP methyl ester carboxylesterase